MLGLSRRWTVLSPFCLQGPPGDPGQNGTDGDPVSLIDSFDPGNVNWCQFTPQGQPGMPGDPGVPGDRGEQVGQWHIAIFSNNFYI